MAQNPFSDPTYGASSSAGNTKPVNPFDDPEYGSPSPGLAARVKQGASRAFDSARTALTDDPNKIAQIAAEQARTALPQSDVQRKMAEEFAPYVDEANKAEGVVDNVKAWGAAGLKRAGQLVSNPGETAKMIAEQLPNSLPGMAGGIAGAKLGAMAGTAVMPGVGTVVGGLAGGVLGGFAGGYGLEKGAAMQDQVQKEAQAQRIDLQDESAVARMVALKQPEFDAAAQRKGVGTAGTDALLNVATMGLAGVGGRTLAKEARTLAQAVKAGTISAADAAADVARLQAANAARNTLGAKALRGAGVVGAEMGGEGLSEGVGQKVAYGNVDAGEVIDEALMGLGTGGAMALSSKAFNKAAGVVDQDATTQNIAAASDGLGALGPAFTTAPGAVDPNAAQAPVAQAPEAPDLSTTLGAGVPRDGVPFTRDIDTSGLAVEDRGAMERARAAMVDYEPGDTTPQWETSMGATAARQGMNMPATEFDTGTLGLESQGRALTPSERMGINPAAGALSRAAAVAVDSGATPVQFLGATGRDLKARATGPGVTNESNVIDVQGRLVEDRAISTPRRLTDQQDGMAARAQGDRLAIQPPAAPSAVPALGGPVGADAARGGTTAVPDGVADGRPGGGSAAGNGTGAAEAGAARAGGRGNSNPALSAPTNLREGLARMRARRQEAADAQTAAQSAPTSAPAVSTARPGAVEAAGAAPFPATTGVNREPSPTQAIQASAQPAQTGPAPAASDAGPGAQGGAAAPAPVGSGEPAGGLTNAATPQNNGAQAAPATGTQGAAQAAQAAVAPRPKNWRTSMLGATPVAKAMGIDTNGKRLAQVVAEIDARDTQAPATPEPAPAPGPARLGRDNTPLSEGGKPFKTRKAAGDAKKLQPMMRVVTVPGGYALAEKTPAQLAAEERAAKRLRTPRTSPAGEPVPAHAFIAASGGLHMRHRNDLGVDGNPRIGNRRLFGGLNRGLSIEQATEMLVADGYLSEGASHNDAYALIKKSLSQPQYNADGIERIAQAESDAQFEDYMAAQEEAAADGDTDPFGMADEFTAEELDEVGYTAADPALQAEVSALIAQADAMDIDTYAILEDIARTYANATQDQYNAAARDALAAAIARSNQDGGSVAAQAAPAAEPAAEQGLNRPSALTSKAQAATENVAPEALELAAQTPAEAAARQDAQEQADKAEAAAKRAEDAAAKAEEERKRIAQASVRAADEFELGLDPLDSLTGQGGLMFSRAAATEVRNLVTLHNLTDENLRFADSMGGIPVPSIGITKVESPFGGFGNITLIAPKGMIDPKAGVPVYDRDAWTARFPTMNFKKVKAKMADAFYERMKPVRELMAGDDDGFISQLWEQLRNASVQSPEKITSIFTRYEAGRVMYAKEVLGKTIKIPMRPIAAQHIFGHAKSWRDFVAKEYGKAKTEQELDDFNLRASVVARKALQENLAERIAKNPAASGALTASLGGYLDRYISDDGMNQGLLDQAIRDAQSYGKKEVDVLKLRDAVRKVVPDNDPGYLAWVSEQVKPLFGAPTITLRGKEVAPTLDNIVDAMTVGATAGAEKSMTFSAGKVAAMLGKQFKSLDEIKAARDQVVSAQAETEGKKATDALLDGYRTHVSQFYGGKDWRGNIDTWAANDDSMEALAKAGKLPPSDASIRATLARMNFKGVDQRAVDMAREAIAALRNAATDYFEAKPQRAVTLDEFKGAVVPKGTSAETIAILEKHGIAVEVHNKTEGAREKAIQKLAKRLDRQSGDVLFTRSTDPSDPYRHKLQAIQAARKQAADVVQADNGQWLLAPKAEPYTAQEARDAQQRIDKLNRALGKYSNVAPAAVLSDAPTAAMAWGRSVARTIGYDVTFIQPNPDFHGVAVGGDAFVSASAEHPEIGLIGHEVLHSFKQSDPDTYEALAERIRPYLKNGVVDAKRKWEDARGGQNTSMAMAEEEVFADLNGAMWLDPLFWREMASNDPSLFRQVAYKFMEVATKAMKGLSRFKADALVTDVDAVRKIIAQEWATQAQEMGNPSEFSETDGPAFSRAPGDQTKTEAFKRWFAGSRVVDADGKPLVLYHGTDDDISVFDESKSRKGFWFSSDDSDASDYGDNTVEAYLSLKNPAYFERTSGDKGVNEAISIAKSEGYDGLIVTAPEDGDASGMYWPTNYVAFRPEQIKSATGNSGAFDPANPDIRFSRTSTATGTQSAWDAPVPNGFDDVIYKLQDKNIDLKRVVEAITKSAGQVADSVNAYLKEELFHKRAAKRVEDFGARELKPLMNQMRLMGLGMEDVEEYLHARHAKEANAVIAQRNPGEPGLQDGGSGMTNQAADNYFAKLDPAQRRKLESVAKNVDAIIDKTRKLYVSYGLENQDVVDGWASMYQHYIPLMREDKDGGMGTGQGFSVKGKETKGRTGSTRKVVDILANIASQREKLIVRGEKNIVAQALVGLAQANPNPDFWEVRSQAPTERVFDPKTGVVVDRPDPLFKSRENVAVAKVQDSKGNVTEQMVVFNEDNPRAVRMAAAMKNLDAGNLEGLLGMSAKITRYFSAINTQYNPVFGVVNLVRDVQGAMVNLAATPLAGQQGKIARDTVSALAGIYSDIRKTRKGGQASSKWAQLWEQMQDDGGTTGYRELFTTSADRANNLKSILNPQGWMDSKWGKVFTADGKLRVPMSMAQKGASEIFGWLSDYNEAMENGVRLAAYKAALDMGMSREQAASLSKNLTVNFNRKGQVGMQAGAVYAFFNAAMQGTARIGQTLFDMDGGDISTLRLSKTGKAVVYGGVTLGVMQALALAGAGFDEEDPPEFVRERSLIIPTGGKTYVSIPMPLGLHVIPGIGRHATEFALSGFDKPAKRALSVIGMFADAFNPIGNAGLSMQTLAPTALDPLVALTENKDWTGKPIARVSFNKALPGHTQWKDTATWYSKMAAEAINWVSGGNEYVAGALSPTPDQIDYLVAQVGGGVAREASKVFQAASTTVNGEELPTYKIPLLGRFAGNAASQASQGTAFYANLDRLNALETEIKGLRKDGRFGEAAQLARENPQAAMIPMANRAERDVQKLRRDKRELIATGATREEVRAKEAQITAVMARLNEAAARRKATAPE